MFENGGHRVVIAADRDDMRSSIAGLLGRESDIQVIGEINAGGDLSARVRELKPDVLVIDCFASSMIVTAGPDGVMTGLPGVRVVAICPWNDSRYAVRVLSSGASAYVLTSRLSRDLAGAVRAAVQHRSFISPGIAGIPERA